MNIKEFIKNLLRPNKTKLLNEKNEPNEQSNVSKQKMFRNANYVGQVNVKEEPTMEKIIEEFIYQYQEQIRINGNNYNASYDAFTRLFYEHGAEDVGKNVENQEKLTKMILKHSKKYKFTFQYSKGNPVFCHVSDRSPEAENITNESENLWKIYLNCERKNIASLSYEVIQEISKLKDCPLKMKFVAEGNESGVNRNYQRNDKIVIWANNSANKEKILNSINQLKMKKPNLFSDNKTLPLTTKEYGIACTNQFSKNIITPYRNMYPTKDVFTYHSELSNIMEDTLLYAFRQVCQNDKKLLDLSNKYYGDNIKGYLELYKSMDKNQMDEVIKICKESTIQCCEKSGLDISYKGKEESLERYSENE